MSTGITVLIVAVVVIAIAVVVALVVRSKRQRQRQRSANMGLPDLGALSTDGLDKEHTSSPSAEHSSSRPNNP